jgi:hypothetical protein
MCANRDEEKISEGRRLSPHSRAAACLPGSVSAAAGHWMKTKKIRYVGRRVSFLVFFTWSLVLASEQQ